MTQRKGQVKVLSIKKFAEICHTTPRTLRFYEEKGLITPYAIDPFTKYRSYNARQARDFLRIKLLQNFGIPLNELQTLVRNNQLNQRLEQQLAKIKEELEEKQKEYSFLEKMKSFLSEDDIHTIFTKETFASHELFCLLVTDANYKNMEAYQKRLIEEAKHLGLDTGKEIYAFYSTTQYEPKGTTIELAIPYHHLKPSKDIRLNTDFIFKKFPKTEALVYTYIGPYEYFSVIYQKLFNYIEKQKIQLSGNNFDIYDLSEKNSKYDVKAKLVFPYNNNYILQNDK